MTYIQFKLSNGDEIICQVVQEPEGEDSNLVIRKAMNVYKVEGADGMRYYTFRPWMTYQMSDQYFQLLNFTHIIGEAKPDALLLEQYQKALSLELDRDNENDRKIEEKYEQILKKLAELDGLEEDSDEPSNVVSLFDKDKLH